MGNTNKLIYIYCDQNKWIELAKGIKSKKSEYENLLNKMKSNVDAGVWAFPLSIIHIAEAMKRKDEESRKILLDLMYSLSRGCSISDYATANIIEFNYWINNGAVNCKAIQNEILAFDIPRIIGLSSADAIVEIKGDKNVTNEHVKTIKKIIVEHSCDRILFDYVCENCSSLNDDEDFYYNCFVTGREEFKSWRTKIETLEEYKEKHVYPAYLIKVFFEEYKEMLSNLSVVGQSRVKSIFDNNTKNKTSTINLLESLPGFNIHNRLVYELFSNPCKEVHKHDFFDLAFLRVAVPYCDIVIGENYWIDRIQHYKLDQKYGTVTATKLLKLENMYDKLG